MRDKSKAVRRLMSKTIVETVIAEADEDGWLILWPDGRVTREQTHDAAERVIKQAASKRTKREKLGMLVTRIEWR
jgi:hypothetical protein